jgi:hypothetical protein
MASQAAKVNALNWIAVNEICYRCSLLVTLLPTPLGIEDGKVFRRSKLDATVDHVIAGAWKDPALEKQHYAII